MWSNLTIPIGVPPLESAWISPPQGPYRDYKPEIVAAMTLAFDTVCRSLLAKESDNDDIRRKLALIILHRTDRGERDPARLADLSFRELMGSETEMPQ